MTSLANPKRATGRSKVDGVHEAVSQAGIVANLNYEEYFKYQYEPSTFATYFNIAAFVLSTGISAEVWRRGWGGTCNKVWELAGTAVDAPALRVLYGKKHYELLWKSENGDNKVKDAAKRVRVTGKQRAV